MKIVQAEMVPSNDSNKKPSFNKLGQTFIDLTEATANIHYVTSVVQQKFGPVHVVVTGDGLKIEDSSGTQGDLHCMVNQALHFNHRGCAFPCILY